MKQDAVSRKSSKRKSVPVQAEPAPPKAESSQTFVLLVEDEALIAEIVGEALEEYGYSVHSVSNAADALLHLANGGQVDVLFTDINLPGDLDGVDLAAHVRDLRPGLPVIFASGRWGRLEELRGQARSAILPKPYSPARACAAVEELVADRITPTDEPARHQELVS